MDQATAFETLKEALSSPPVLAMYDPNKDTKVSVAMGGILLQTYEDEWKPVAYVN